MLLVLLAWSGLVRFTLRAYHNPHFVGVPTPRPRSGSLLILLFDSPAFLGTRPLAALGVAIVLAVAMVIPVPFPKIRRGFPPRGAMSLTGVALVLALLPLQFRPVPGNASTSSRSARRSSLSSGRASYYLAGPFTVPKLPVDPAGSLHEPGPRCPGIHRAPLTRREALLSRPGSSSGASSTSTSAARSPLARRRSSRGRSSTPSACSRSSVACGCASTLGGAVRWAEAGSPTDT